MILEDLGLYLSNRATVTDSERPVHSARIFSELGDRRLLD